MLLENAAKLGNVLGLATLVATLLRFRARACAVLACLAAMLCAATNASALEGVQPKTRVWDFSSAAPLNIRLNALASAEQRPGISPAQLERVSVSLLAARGLTSVPLLARGPGGKMLGEAMGVLKATPAAERVGMARELLGQIQARATGGAWKATEMGVAGGGRAWVGETHTLVVDAAGRVFSGPHVGGAAQFGVVEGQIGVTSWSGLKGLF